MKISTLISILQNRNQDDEILVPCGCGGQLTDELRIMPVPLRHEMSAPRRVALLPLAGEWVMQLPLSFEVSETTPRLPSA